MLSFTYCITVSSAVALASAPPSSPPTPSATMARNATRCSPSGRCCWLPRFVAMTLTRLWTVASRKWSWFSERTFPTCVTPWTSISSSRGLRVLGRLLVDMRPCLGRGSAWNLAREGAVVERSFPRGDVVGCPPIDRASDPSTSGEHQQGDADDGGDGPVHRPLPLAGHEAAGQDIDPLEDPDDPHEDQQHASNGHRGPHRDDEVEGDWCARSPGRRAFMTSARETRRARRARTARPAMRALRGHVPRRRVHMPFRTPRAGTCRASGPGRRSS